MTGLGWFHFIQAVDCIKRVNSINVELRSGGNAENYCFGIYQVQSNHNRTFMLRFIFAEVSVFRQNGQLLPHVKHLKEYGEAAASGLL